MERLVQGYSSMILRVRIMYGPGLLLRRGRTTHLRPTNQEISFTQAAFFAA
jgi:hypothetical protein